MKEKSTGNPTHQKQAFWFPALMLALFLLPTALLNAQTATPPAAGDGTMTNPWQIATLDNLYWLSQTTSEWVADKYFIQTADIEATNTSGWAGGLGFSPIGNTTNLFNGNYNGDGHTIDGLTINRPTTPNIGLFGAMRSGTLMHLGVINANITGQAATGILAGLTHVTNFSVSIVNCYTSGTVTGTINVGGLVGFAGDGTVELCHSTATVVSTATSGIFRSVGGLIGYAPNNNNNMVIRNCYAQGSVTGASGTNIGGLIGFLQTGNIVTKCYATGAVILSGGTSSYVGGLIGRANTPVDIDGYWDTETSGRATSAGGTGIVGKTTAEMKTQNTFAGWNFTSVWDISIGNYPYLNQRAFSGGNGTVADPYQISTINDFLTLTAWPSAWKKHYIQTANIDAAGVTVSPIGNSIYPFSGSYNGQNYTANNFSYNSGYRIGLFGLIKSATLTNINATNVTITSTVSSIGGLIGSATNATIDNCFVSGNVSGIWLTGGFVGRATNCTFSNCGADVVVTGIVNPAIPSINEISNFGLGGFVGALLTTPSTFTNCYARGSVSGYKIGGFVGGMTELSINPPDPAMGFTLTNCYAANSLTVYTTYSQTGLPIDPPGEKGGLYGESDYAGNSIAMNNSFWDQELSGTTNGYIDGTGKTTAEMKTQDTYTGWDFSTPAWKINASINNGFPYLAWQIWPSCRVCNVTQNLFYAGIQEAMEIANPGDIIMIAAGTYTETVTTLGKGGITLSPGSSAGTVTIVGNLTLHEGDVLDMELFADDYDKFIVSGDVQLGHATLKLSTGDGYLPEAGTNYSIIEYGRIDGGFFNKSFVASEEGDHSFVIDYDGNTSKNGGAVVLTNVRRLFKLEIKTPGR